MADNIPTGYAPVYLGNFATERTAMAQKLNDLMYEKAQEEKTRQGEERASLLNALSFEAVQGLGLEVQKEHLKELESLRSKWSQRWIDSGKKFSDTDYFDLAADKANMEQKIAGYKHNVARLPLVQKELMENGENYSLESLSRLEKYIKDGNIGRDSTNILVPMPDITRYLRQNYSTLSETEPTITRDWNEDKTGMIETTDNTEAIREKIYSSLEADPYFNTKMNEPHVQEKNQEAIERFVQEIATKKSEGVSPTTTEYNLAKIESLSPANKTLEDKYNLIEKGAAVEDFGNIEYLHQFAIRPLKHDKAALYSLIGKQSANFGIVQDVIVKKNGDIQVINKDGDTKTIPVPKDWSDENAAKDAILNFINEFSPALSKQIPDYFPAVVTPSWEVNINEKAEITSYENLTEKMPKGDLTNEKIIANIEDLFGEQSDIRELRRGTKGIKWDGTKYDIETDDGLKLLLEKINQKYQEAYAAEGPAPASAQGEKQELSVSEYNKAKGTNYTKQQIESYFGNQYLIVD